MIEIKQYIVNELNIKNVMRYMGQRNGEVSPELAERVDGLLPVFLNAVDGKVCFEEREIPSVESVSLTKHLEGCGKTVYMAATIGVQADRLRMRMGALSPLDELILDAMGTEAVEQVCDRFCSELAGKYPFVTTRFSPGYGDLALEYQSTMIRELDTARKIGVTLNSSLLMSPTKSVTAIVGIKE